MELSSFELQLLIYEAAAVVDSTFETWLGATFAIIIVAHMVGMNLSFATKLLIGCIYAAATLFLYTRYAHVMAYVATYYKGLAELGSNVGEIAEVSTISLVRRVIFGLGTFSALAFLFFPTLSIRKRRGGGDA